MYIQSLHKWLSGYLVVVGLAVHVVLIVAFVFALKYDQLTPSQWVLKVVEKGGIDQPWLVNALSPAPRFSEHVLDGYLRATHPRILLPELADGSGRESSAFMEHRTALYRAQGIQDFDPCGGGAGSVLKLAACWTSSGDASVADELIHKLKTSFPLETPDVQSQYGNGWQLAFAYDLLSSYPGLGQDDRDLLESRLEYALRDYLTVLNDSSPSLWHGRTTLASMAWLTAVVLDAEENAQRSRLIAQAQGHFLNVVRAVELTEGWPEGYNYWIQNRALLFSLAGSAYLNGLEGAKNQQRVRKLLHRVGLWHIYGVRPDNRFEGLGDEGARVDLKDETRRVIDIIAQATRDPVFATFSRYLEALHGAQSYYRGYRWGFRLFNDPTLVAYSDGKQGLKAFDGMLPTAELFGRGAFNQGYIRSDWSKDATFISFRAGQTLTHHGHYDAGHFSLFKAAPLAINSSTYGDYIGLNRLNYSIRTVAKNSLLILRPGEQVRPKRFFAENVADGGQRIIIPTGSAVQSVADWAENRRDGHYFAGGRVEYFDRVEGDYVYVATDLTDAYNTPEHDEGGRGGKVSKVTRNLVYLYDEDMLLVHDRVVSSDPAYTKKWLLHSVNRPELEQAVILKGTALNGILQSSANTALLHNDSGYLRVDRLYPEDAVIRLVGGPDYQFYVEDDGDDADLDGKNYAQGASIKSWFDVGMWRIEIQPGTARRDAEFLVALSPSIGKPRAVQAQPVFLQGTHARGVATEQRVLVFVKPVPHGRLQITVPGGLRRLYVFGIPALMQIHVAGGEQQDLQSTAEGVVQLSVPAGSDQVMLKW